MNNKKYTYYFNTLYAVNKFYNGPLLFKQKGKKWYVFIPKGYLEGRDIFNPAFKEGLGGERKLDMDKKGFVFLDTNRNYVDDNHPKSIAAIQLLQYKKDMNGGLWYKLDKDLLYFIYLILKQWLHKNSEQESS